MEFVDGKNRGVGSVVNWCRDKLELKNRAMSQYGGGRGGGVVENKKISANSPVNFRCNGEELLFLKIL